MRRILKLLFSQVSIIALLIVVQILILVSIVAHLSSYYFYVDLLFIIISVAVVIYIINHHANPIYKLAWVIPILIFPLFGGLLYIFIMGQTHTKYFFAKLKRLELQSTKGFSQSTSVLNEIESSHPERVSTVKYINNTTGLSAYRCEEAKYFSVGEEKWKALLFELEKAEKYIFIEYFIIKQGEMWNSVLEILKRKAAAGVDVRVMYDGMGSMEHLPRKYPKELEKYNIKCRVFSPFTPFLSALQNHRDHRKIVVIDGVTAFTGGINLSDEYVNIDSPLGHWKDMATMIKGEAALSFTMIFLQLWNVTSREKIDMSDYIPNYTPKSGDYHGYVMPYSDNPQDRYEVGEFIYLDIINKAKKYVHITTPYLVLDHEMVVALKNAAKGGVDIKIICPSIADHWYVRAVGYSYYKELIECGVKIYEYTPGFIHGKTFCSDGEIAVVGSINLDYRSLFLHFECAAWFLDSPIVSAVASDFEQTLKKCRPITIEDCNKISPFKKLVNAVLRIFAPLM